MAGGLSPESILESLGNKNLAPFYLFYGPNEFRLERVLEKIRKELVAGPAKDFNLEICYGGETEPSDIITRAQTIPFMSDKRLIVVRRTEEYSADQLNRFLTYFQNPSSSTCLIFLASRTDFKIKFFSRIRSLGYAVQFSELKAGEIVPWIRKTARELGLEMTTQACVYLQQIGGNTIGDLYSELVKLQLRHGAGEIGEEQIRELAIHSRVYSIFELMKTISEKDLGNALLVLNRFLDEEDSRSGPLKFLGMLNRQVRLLWQTKTIINKGGKSRDVASNLGVPPFSAGELMKQSKKWSPDALEKGISLMYEADRLLKSGSRPKAILENLVLSLCS